MKVVFLADSFLLDRSTGVNGTQVQMYNLASIFARRGMEVHYISRTSSQGPDHETVDKIELHWIRRGQGLFSWLADLRLYRQLVDEIRPDVIYQRGRSSLTWLAAHWAARHGRKFVWGSNGEDSCDFWKVTGRLLRSGRPLLRKWALFLQALAQDLLIHRGVRGAEVIVNQTVYQKSRLLKNYGKTGVVLPSYFLPQDEQAAMKKERVVLWLANLSRNKQPEKFLDLAETCLEMNDRSFVLGGGTADKEYLQELHNRAAQVLNCRMTGPIPFEETSTLFSQAVLFVNTSKQEAEGLPNTFIQAMLAGTPILSLNHDPNGWISQHDLGYCANGNMDDFLCQGMALIKDQEGLLQAGERCSRFAIQTFAADSTIDQYIELFRLK